VYITVNALLGIGAVNSQNNLVFLIFGLALGAILVSGVVSGSIMMGIRLERLAVPPARAGERARIGYRVVNTNRLMPVFAVSVLERGLAPVSPRELLPSPEPEPRFFGLFAMRLPPKVPRPHAFVQHVPPSGEAEAWTAFVPQRRGVFAFDRVRVTTTFPLGIVEKSIVFEQDAVLEVEPRVEAVSGAALRSLLATGRSSERSGGRRGDGLDFYGLREYVPGDPMRNIAWRTSARLGTTLVRETEAPADETFIIDLDITAEQLEGARANRPTDPLARVESDYERAVSVAASLAAAGVRRHMRVGLRCEAAGVWLPPDGSARHITHLTRVLATFDAPEHRVTRAEAAATERRPMRSRGEPVVSVSPGNAAALAERLGIGSESASNEAQRVAPRRVASGAAL
jgi:uncharacterized protein (DUF58 family)